MGKPKRKPQYLISLKLGEALYSSKGESIEAALETLGVPTKIVTKGFLHVEGKGKKLDKMFMPVQLKRLLYPISRKIQAKNLSLLLR